eukprot:COSAG06_NODE_2084_length_7635_cov_1.676221_2_plen_136_part_00
MRWQTAGLPIGSKIIQINGVAVSSKEISASIMGQLSTSQHDCGPIAFTFQNVANHPIAMAETVVQVQATLVEAPSPAPAPCVSPAMTGYVNAAALEPERLMDPDGFRDALDHEPADGADEDLDMAIAQATDAVPV